MPSRVLMLVTLTLAAVLSCRAGEPAPRRDADGEPLPAGVLARLGSARLRPGASWTDLAVSPDGRLLASVYMVNGDCDLWSPSTGKLVRRIDLHLVTGYWYTRLAFTDGGKTLLALTAGKTIKARWLDAATGTERRRLELGPCHGDMPMALAPRAGLAAVASSMDRMVRIYNLADGALVCGWQVNGRMAVGLDFSPDGRRLAVCDRTDTVRIHDTATGAQSMALRRDNLPIVRVAYARTGRTLVTRSLDRDDNADALSVWSTATGRERRRLKGSSSYHLALAISTDGRTIATGGMDKDLLLLDAATGKEPRRLRTWPMSMQAVFFPDGKTLAVASNSGTITLWDVNSGKLVPVSPDPLTEVKQLAFSADGRTVIGSAERVIAWDAATGRAVRRFPASSDVPLLNALAPDGSLLAMAGEEHELPVVYLLDARTGKRVHTLQAKGDEPMASLRFTPDSRQLVSGGWDQKARVWDVATGRPIYELQGHNGLVDLLAISGDGRWLATASSRSGDRDVRLWDLANGREVRRFQVRHGWASALAFSHNGRYLAGGESDPGAETVDVQVWETATGKERLELAGHKEFISGVAWSPDDRMLATASRARERGTGDQGVMLWEFATGEQRLRITGQRAISSVAFSPEGRRLAVASHDGPVLVHDLMYLHAHEPLTDAALQATWTDLAGKDAAAAWHSMIRLIADPARTVGFLRGHLQPARAPDTSAIRRLIIDLDSRRFATRAKANAELEKLGRLAEPALRRALAGHPSAEVRSRVERLLQDLEKRNTEDLRDLRAAEILERIDTAEARELLSLLASGSPLATLTTAAQSAVDRLKGRRR